MRVMQLWEGNSAVENHVEAEEGDAVVELVFGPHLLKYDQKSLESSVTKYIPLKCN